MMQLPRPQRRQVESTSARNVLDWADTAFYVFCLVFTAVAAVAMLFHGWALIDPISIPTECRAVFAFLNRVQSG